MRCDEAQARVSAAFDLGPDPGAAVDEHVRTCASCQEFERQTRRVRQYLRYSVVETVPDVTPAVRASVVHRRPARRAVLAPVAAAIVGAMFGAAVIGLGPDRDPTTAAADLSSDVLAAQRDVHSLIAQVEVVERGWHDAVSVRTYAGDLAYRAPESLALTLDDQTAYPSISWVPNDVAVVVADDESWNSGPAGCPRELLPSCTPAAPRTRAVEAREPFPDAATAPLDLIVPVGSFAGSADTPVLATGERSGRPGQLVEVTAAQADPMLAVLRQAGNWRAVHPADRVRLWLDDETLVPLEVAVYPSSDADRAEWAARLGYDDDPAVPILGLRLTDVVLDTSPTDDAFPAAPAGAVVQSQGFRDAPPEETGIGRPDGLASGFRDHRAGFVETATGPPVAVRSWSDGRAWVTVRMTREWLGGRLFGGLGDPVREITLVGGGTAYVGGGGTRVAIHGTDGTGPVDTVVNGTLTETELVDIAAGLGIDGQSVPSDWPEAAAATVADAEAALPGLLLPASLEGYDAPGVRVEGGIVEFAFLGPGARNFVLVEAPGSMLAAPLERDAYGVALRGTTARYSPTRGELEWIEAANAISLRSEALTLAELVAMAETLEPA